MSEILTAAFLVFLGSQAPCPKPCQFGDCMPSFGAGDMALFYMPPIPVASGVSADIAAFPSRAALDQASAEVWFGPKCNAGLAEFEVNVLDVKAGRWFKVKQTFDVVMVPQPATPLRTGKLRSVVR